MRHTIIPMAVALTLAAISTQAFAEDTAKPPLASPLTFNEAIAIALEAQPGTIAEIGLEHEDGRVVIEIEVVNQFEQEIEFQLDAETGEILSTHLDDDPSDDPEAQEEDDD